MQSTTKILDPTPLHVTGVAHACLSEGGYHSSLIPVDGSARAAPPTQRLVRPSTFCDQLPDDTGGDSGGARSSWVPKS